MVMIVCIQILTFMLHVFANVCCLKFFRGSRQFLASVRKQLRSPAKRSMLRTPWSYHYGLFVLEAMCRQRVNIPRHRKRGVASFTSKLTLACY